jgi:hypothetical protein
MMVIMKTRIFKEKSWENWIFLRAGIIWVTLTECLVAIRRVAARAIGITTARLASVKSILPSNSVTLNPSPAISSRE